MAHSILPSPDDQYGPCHDTCTHTDCELTRQMAAKICRICGHSIGYDRGFYSDSKAVYPTGHLVHSICFETKGLND